MAAGKGLEGLSPPWDLFLCAYPRAWDSEPYEQAAAPGHEHPGCPLCAESSNSQEAWSRWQGTSAQPGCLGLPLPGPAGIHTTATWGCMQGRGEAVGTGCLGQSGAQGDKGTGEAQDYKHVFLLGHGSEL